VQERVHDADPDLVLIAGDLSYAEGGSADWDEWFAMTEDTFAETPVMTVPGNHET
jgi:3',5'-cyclic AMP phosphodiesterase CpdA